MSSTLIKRTGTLSGDAHRGRSVCKTVTGREEREKENSTRMVHPTGFLKQRLAVLPKPVPDDTSLKEYLTEENYHSLLECAVRYAGLLGKTFEMPSGTVHERINRLYYCFADILPEGQNLNMDVDSGEMLWIIYYHHGWISHLLYWMPVSFITRLSGRIREISMSFMHRFIRANRLTHFQHCYEYEFLFEMRTEYIHENCEEDEKQKVTDLIDSYFNGEISVLLDEIYMHHSVEDIVSALDDYTPADPLEQKLTDCFKKGLPLISGQDCIMAYDYNPYEQCFTNENYEYDEDYEPYSLDRVIRYVYSISDPVTGELEQMSSQYIQEMYAVEPVSCMILYPDSELFVPDDYPERFSQWFTEMVEITKEITKEITRDE